MSRCKCCGEEIGNVDVCPICGAAHVVAPPPPPQSVAPQPVAPQPQPPAQTTTNRPTIQNDLDRFNPCVSDNHCCDDDDCDCDETVSVNNNANNGSCCDWEKIFTNKNWENNYSDFAEENDEDGFGIILTNTTNLKSKTLFMKKLADFVEYKANEDGIYYCLLDLATQKIGSPFATCSDVVRILKKVYESSVPYYLLIIGDTSVVPSIVWDNESGDDDETVMSDLPYMTLNTTSPWEGVRYNFDNVTAVGRIPTHAQNEFIEAIQYLANAVKYTPYNKLKAFSYTAKQWVNTTKEEFAHIAPYMITSPEYTSDRTTAERGGLKLIKGFDSSLNLLCFNLHGSDATHKWYGQLGSSYPIATDGDVITYGRNNKPFVLCTEACYGARPTIKPNSTESSIVSHVLSYGGMAFVGSTRIAYGCVDGGMCCADIIAHNFTKVVASGYPVGDAFLCALAALCKGRMDEVEIKTLAEFGLYGDPSVRLVEMGGKTKKKTKIVNVPKVQQNKALSFTLMSCDTFGFVGRANKSASKSNLSDFEKMQIKKMAANIRVIGKNALKSANAPLSDVDPQVFKVMGGTGYRAVYSKVENNMKTIVKLHMDDNGNVEQIYTSK